MAPLTRRELLRRFGLMAGSLPLLDALGNRAFADPTTPRRLVCIVLGHGIFPQHWLPWVPTGMPISTATPGNLLKAPSDYLQAVAAEQRSSCHVIDLAGRTGALSPIFSEKWQALKQKTAFINHLGCSNQVVQGHTSTAALGGYKVPDVPGDQYGTFVGLVGETIDVTIARKLNSPLLTLKAVDVLWDATGAFEVADRRGGQASTRRNATDTDWEPVPYLTNPTKTWDKLFSTWMAPSTGPVKRDPTQRRLALLDRTLGQVQAIRRDQRLSANDQARLDSHAALLEAQRTTLATMPPQPVTSTATPPTRPVDQPSTDDTFNEAKGRLYKAQFMNASAAIKLGLSQVVSIDAALENQWVTEGISLTGSQAYHFNAGHLTNPSLPNIEECRKTQQFVFDTIADFLTDLDTVEDAATGATYLDNTLVLITTEHDGRPNGHLRGSVNSLLVGGFGTFTGGKIYDYAQPALWQANPDAIYTGFSHSRLLYTVLNAFNVSTLEQAKLSIQGVAQSWSGSDLTDWGLPLADLV
jgi:hypothetical protein